MPLESSTTIAGLDATWPLNDDDLDQGDNHIRLVKSVLKTIFPGTGSAGFAIPITAKETEINFLVGVSSAIQPQLNAIYAKNQSQDSSIAQNSATIGVMLQNLYAPVGTRMVFHQAAPPAGWVQDTSYNDGALRVVSSFGTGYGGLHSFAAGCTVVANHTHSNNFSLSMTAAGAHSHSYTRPVAAANAAFGAAVGESEAGSTTSTNGDHTHVLSVSGGVTGVNGPVVWQPLYMNVIVCQKN